MVKYIEFYNKQPRCLLGFLIFSPNFLIFFMQIDKKSEENCPQGEKSVLLQPKREAAEYDRRSGFGAQNAGPEPDRDHARFHRRSRFGFRKAALAPDQDRDDRRFLFPGKDRRFLQDLRERTSLLLFVAKQREIGGCRLPQGIPERDPVLYARNDPPAALFRRFQSDLVPARRLFCLTSPVRNWRRRRRISAKRVMCPPSLVVLFPVFVS